MYKFSNQIVKKKKMSETVGLLNNNMIESYPQQEQKQYVAQKLYDEFNQQKLVINDEPKIRIYQQNVDMPTKTSLTSLTIGGIAEEDNNSEMSLKSQATVASQKSINTKQLDDDDDIGKSLLLETCYTVTNISRCFNKQTETNKEYASLLLKVGDTKTYVNKSNDTVAPTTINVDNNQVDHHVNNDIYIHLNDDESSNGACIKPDNNDESYDFSNGQTLYACMSEAEPQQQQQSQLHDQRLEKVSRNEQAVSLISKADCLSGAVNESVIATASGNLYVVNIHIQQSDTELQPKLQESQLQLENLKQLNSIQARDQEVTHKQVTVVKLNDNSSEQKNDYFDLTTAHAKSDLQLGIDKMVHKTQIKNNNNNNSDLVEVGSVTAGGGTSVTELNVNNPNYLYYMMSSGQFSPCETLDSGTGSDLESNGNNLNVNVPKMELHLKTNKIRLNNTAKSLEHQRASSLTDSEESEASSLSCDSLHSAEFMRTPSSTHNGKKPHSFATLLPDSLLRDIRDRATLTDICHTRDSLNAQEYAEVEEKKIVQTSAKSSKRASMPSKTFVIDQENGVFEDTKMNSMPRKYEADKYYDFHVKEHENYHSFNVKNDADISDNEDNSVKDYNYDNKSLQDESFAGFKDIRCTSTTSTIRSSKGTVRGVKNRVRNGIATFLQLQQPNVKSFKEKDVGKVVLYTTSMGIIRDTYAKCQNVKQILKTNLIKFEERDVFMSLEYQQEIKERMQSTTIKVPQLFVEGQYIGDADIVERLNESGELRQLLKPYKSIATTFTCQTCGGYRLLPCPSCNGSKKSVHRNHFTAEFVALKCMNCDEVGLVKCHNC